MSAPKSNKAESPDRRPAGEKRTTESRAMNATQSATALENYYAERRRRFLAEGFWRHNGTING